MWQLCWLLMDLTVLYVRIQIQYLLMQAFAERSRYTLLAFCLCGQRILVIDVV